MCRFFCYNGKKGSPALMRSDFPREHSPILYGKVDVNSMNNEELVEQIRNGYHVTENMQVLYENNLPLIKRFIKPYTYYEPEDDLLQEAYFGLWEAVQHYESSENVLFMSYARYWVRQSIQRYMEYNGSIIRMSSAYRKKIARYKKSVKEFQQTHGRMPTDEEIAEYSLLPVAEIPKIQLYMQEIVSLDAPIKADDELSLADTVADEYSLENELIDKIFNEYQETELWGIVEHYTDVQQEQVIREYYKEGKTLSQIARECDISLERVRQYKEAGLRRLRTGKAGREIREKFEIVEASAYRSGFRGFKEHGDSIVEYIAIRRAELEKKYKEVLNG